MIVASLYPTQKTFTQGSSGEYTAEITATWGNTYDSETVNDVSAYWLGYISKDNLPEQYKCGIIYFDESANKVIVKDITNKANFPCTYGSFESYGSTLSRYTLARSVDGVETITANGRTRLYNQLYPEYIGVSYNGNSNYNYALHITLYYVLFDAGGNIVNTSYSNMYKLTETTGILFSTNNYGRNAVKEAYNFLFKNSEYTLTIRDHDFIITANDLGSGTCYLSAEDGYSVRLFLCGYEVNSYASISTSTNARPMGFIVKTQETHLNHAIESIAISNGADYLESTEWWDLSGSSAGGAINDHTSVENPLYSNYWGFDEEIDNTEIQRVNNFNSSSTGYAYGYTDHLYLHRDNQSGYSAKCVFTPYYPISTVEKTFSLSIRVDVSGTYTPSYSEYFTYATDVTSSNEFLAKLKTGDITNTTFKNSLREWQYENIQSDDFDEEDVPPYEPPSPGGDDDPGSDDPVDTPLMTGDDQDLQTDRTMTAANDFITLYNITPPMLSIFGRTLWKSIADYNPQDPTSADIFKNFFAILNEEVTGTLDIGAILQFVVSVRQYPFNVAGMGITTSAGDSIKIGTGVYPISLGSGANVQKLTSTIGLIDCGSVTIANYKDFKLYNDFRDYLNATVTAFLPYCGSVELNPIEVIHNTVHCYYAIDFYTGECTAYITTTDGNHTVLSAIKNGSIGVLVPITATNSGQISARHMSDNAKDAGLIVSNLGNLFGAVANAAQGNIAGFGSSILGMAQNSLTQKQMQAERQGRSAVLAPSLSGGSGAAAFYQPSCPSIVVRRGTYARQKINNYPQTCAYPSTTSGTLKSFHGYTECYNVNVSGLNCTEEERAAVKSILESGCYLP